MLVTDEVVVLNVAMQASGVHIVIVVIIIYQFVYTWLTIVSMSIFNTKNFQLQWKHTNKKVGQWLSSQWQRWGLLLINRRAKSHNDTFCWMNNFVRNIAIHLGCDVILAPFKRNTELLCMALQCSCWPLSLMPVLRRQILPTSMLLSRKGCSHMFGKYRVPISIDYSNPNCGVFWVYSVSLFHYF
jgi:hypothetical protein